MTINVATAARKTERTQDAEAAYALIERLAHPGDDIDIVISVSAPHDEDQAALFLNTLMASPRYREGLAVTGRRIAGDFYEVYVRVAA